MAALFYVVVFAIALIPTAIICKLYERMEDREIERDKMHNQQTTITTHKN